MDPRQVVYTSAQVMAQAAEKLVDEIGAVAYAQLVLKALGVPPHKISDDPQTLSTQMAQALQVLMLSETSDDQFYNLIGEVAKAGGTEVKQCIAAELLLIQQLGLKFEEEEEE